MKQVTIYTTPTCVFCKMAKKYLSSCGVEYEEVDVSVDHKAAREMITRSGQMGVPVIEIGDEIIVGFDRPNLDKLLGISQ